MKVADEVWIAYPDRADFEIDEIVQRAAKEAGKEPLRPGVYVHTVQHCVANRAPIPDATACWLKPRRAVAVYFASAILTILRARDRRRLRSEKICPKDIASC